MDSKNELVTFFEASWRAIVKEYDRNSLKEFEETIQICLIGFTQGGSLQNTIFNILQVMTVGFRVTIEENTDLNKDLNCQIILHKPNEEIIPVYIAQENLDIHWDKFAEKSGKKGWKLAFVSNLKTWTVYGVNTLSNHPTQMSYEFVRIEDIKKIKSKELKVLVRILLTLISFDLKNDYTWKYTDKAPERQMEESEWTNEINQEVWEKMLNGNFEITEPLFSFSEETKRIQIETLELMMKGLKDHPDGADLYIQYAKTREQLLDELKLKK